MASSTRVSSKVASGVIFIAIVVVALVVAVYQTSSSTSRVGTAAQAANPCESYGKLKDIAKNGIVKNKYGTVQSKNVDRFVWTEDANSKASKVVVMCAGAKLNKRLGGNMTYAELKVGDKVYVTGLYGDTTKTTILAASLKSDSTVNQETVREVKSSSANPFGVMISGNNTSIKIQSAKNLGAAYYRPISVFLDKWSGSCAECDAAVAGGLKLLLTIRNNGGQQQPTTPPTDLNSYKNTLTQIVVKYKPEVLVIENEENSGALFYTGSPQQYLQELKAGCDVAHQNGIKCANGGLVSALVAALVANHYDEAGNAQQAAEYLNRTVGGDKSAMITSSKAQEQITKGKALLTGYKAAGADFINFHCYIADTNALGEAVTYMRTASGLPVMINEVGQQKNTDPTQVTNIMKKVVELGLPYAVWFSMDIQGYGGATGLTDTSGTLRSNGQAYADFIKNTY